MWTFEILKTIALLCATNQYPQIQYTCERNVMHCMVTKKEATPDSLVYCFTEDKGK